MQLTIRFGLDLDGYRSISPTSHSGEVTLGPFRAAEHRQFAMTN